MTLPQPAGATGDFMCYTAHRPNCRRRPWSLGGAFEDVRLEKAAFFASVSRDGEGVETRWGHDSAHDRTRWLAFAPTQLGATPTQVVRDKKLLKQYLARVYWLHFVSAWRPLVIVDDFHVAGISTLLAEADSPLVTVT